MSVRLSDCQAFVGHLQMYEKPLKFNTFHIIDDLSDRQIVRLSDSVRSVSDHHSSRPRGQDDFDCEGAKRVKQEVMQ